MINKLFQKFLFRILVLSIILAAAGVVLYFIIPPGKFSPATPYLVLFFFTATSILYYVLLKATHNKFSRFVSQFMVMTFAKLLLYIIVIVVYIFLNKADAVPFVITFFVLYLVYTIYELMSFMNDQKKMEK